jgi:hypothetical protein
MKKPQITIHDALTDVSISREMTDEEYAALVETGWTMEPKDEATTADADAVPSAE